MSTSTPAALVERISRLVRDRGDIELFMRLDRIMDKETEPERATALGGVIKDLMGSKTRTTQGQGGRGGVSGQGEQSGQGGGSAGSPISSSSASGSSGFGGHMGTL